MISRLEERLQELRLAQRTGLAAYQVVGTCSPERGLEALQALVKAGVSLLELGLPFSDPVADGPQVARAHLRALERGFRMKQALDLASAFRLTDTRTPLVLMGYLNPLLSQGLESFCAEASAAGVDALIVVDLPLEHAAILVEPARQAGLVLIPLVAPNASPERLLRVQEEAQSLVYLVTRAGTTGQALPDLKAVAVRAQKLRTARALGVMAGFGLSEPEQVRELRGSVDWVVVGSRLVSALEDSEHSVEALVEAVEPLIQALQD